MENCNSDLVAKYEYIHWPPPTVCSNDFLKAVILFDQSESSNSSTCFFLFLLIPQDEVIIHHLDFPIIFQALIYNNYSYDLYIWFQKTQHSPLPKRVVLPAVINPS